MCMRPTTHGDNCPQKRPTALLVIVAVGLFAIQMGCQTAPIETGRIVGDSMSLGEAYPTMGMIPQEMYGECGGGSCTTCEGGSMGGNTEGMVPGCAGEFCDGRCGGRCGIAQRLQGTRGNGRLRGRVQNYVQNKSHIARAIRCTHNHCANGHCGGAVGPDYGAVHYPYYTTRGPRDFLMANPPSIGPY